MTRYLLDANVVREFRPGGHVNVAAWRASVDATDLYISAITLYEIRRGFEALKRRNPARAAQGLAAVAAIEASYSERIVPVDGPIVPEWARLLGEKDRHRDDMALAATARVRGLVLVTRNAADFAGRGVQVLDPFKRLPTIAEV